MGVRADSCAIDVSGIFGSFALGVAVVRTEDGGRTKSGDSANGMLVGMADGSMENDKAKAAGTCMVRIAKSIGGAGEVSEGKVGAPIRLHQGVSKTEGFNSNTEMYAPFDGVATNLPHSRTHVSTRTVPNTIANNTNVSCAVPGTATFVGVLTDVWAAGEWQAHYQSLLSFHSLAQAYAINLRRNNVMPSVHELQPPWPGRDLQNLMLSQKNCHSGTQQQSFEMQQPHAQSLQVQQIRLSNNCMDRRFYIPINDNVTISMHTNYCLPPKLNLDNIPPAPAMKQMLTTLFEAQRRWQQQENPMHSMPKSAQNVVEVNDAKLILAESSEGVHVETIQISAPDAAIECKSKSSATGSDNFKLEQAWGKGNNGSFGTMNLMPTKLCSVTTTFPSIMRRIRLLELG